MILYDDLQRNLTTGNVCAFVGAGLSAGAGLPGWYDLIAELSARISYDLPPPKYATGDALIDAAQAYVNRQGLHALISHLKDRLDTTGVQPTAAHRALARLPISLVFTANFDDLLERTFRDAGKRVEVVVKDSSIPFMRRGPDTVNIVKLYGDLDQPDTIVLARQQYESYFLQRPQMVKLLETELVRFDTLYLGWSGSDPYFKLVFGELLSRFGGMMRPGYAVMFDVTDAQRDELARKQIRLVELPAGDRTAQIAEWLGNLVPKPMTNASLVEHVSAPIPQQDTSGTRGSTSTRLSSAGSEQSQRRFSVNDTVERFREWFYQYTTSEEGVHVCSVCGQDVYLGFDGRSTKTALKIDGYRVEGEEHVRILEPWLIRFTLRDHGQRITVTAERFDVADIALRVEVERYFTHLLTAVVTEYPETREAIFLPSPGRSVTTQASHIESPVKSSASAWKTSTLRELLTSAFNDEELMILCFDHFPSVHEDFAIGMSKKQKIQRLLDYCVRREQVEQLLTAVQTANPAQYRRYEDRLRS